MRKLTNEEFLERLHIKHGTEYEPLEEYPGMNNKIKVLHRKCGRVYETTPWKMLIGGCEKCGYDKTHAAQRKTSKQFLDEVKALVGDEYTFLDEYVNNTTKLLVRHNACGHIYSVTPRDFLSGRRCPMERYKRAAKGINKTHAYFAEKAKERMDKRCELVGKYVNAKTKIAVKCTRCGLVFDALPGHVLEGKGCPKCWKIDNGEYFRKKPEVFRSQIEEIWRGDFKLLSDYESQKIKVEVLHVKCGRVFFSTPDSLLHGNGCPYCKESKGEKAITKWLIDHKIDFIPQYAFNDCVYKGKLRFDFAIMCGDTVVMLIEYNGVQHYQPVEQFGGESAYKELQKRDAIKKQYAASHKIPFIEIKYTED